MLLGAGHEVGPSVAKAHMGYDVKDGKCQCQGPVLHLAGNEELLNVSEQG